MSKKPNSYPLGYVSRLWGNPVVLETEISGKSTRLAVDTSGKLSTETGSGKGAAA